MNSQVTPVLREGLSGTHNKGTMLGSFVIRTLPQVQKLLQFWQAKAQGIPDPTLRQQALDSLAHKAFHCQGGAVYAAYPRNAQLLEFIIAYQTMCDYLDNLCDRAGSTDGHAFKQLHQSLLDALDSNRNPTDYYKNYPYQDDGGYLSSLVKRCRENLSSASNYQQVQQEIMALAEWYSTLQVAKHIHIEQREQVLRRWADYHVRHYPGVYWQEFSAASGSTLAIFALMRQAYMGSSNRQTYLQLLDVYFPWICGLHILLDYFIDQEEDQLNGDLNFVFYFTDEAEMMARLVYILTECYQKAAMLPDYSFHEMVVDGLLALYLSDHKVELQGYHSLRRQLLNQGGKRVWRTYHLCRTVRHFL
ncbi:MAG: tetraprenyl-beta-curcumene synthase family protein [Bacillota bacterium]|nr:tetraprenyl-beta-curcumene synthase family protein [Bacillota bacterium]